MSKTSKEDIVAGGLTQKEINTLKNKHGKITLVTIEGDEGQEELHFWFKQPDRNILAAAVKIGERDQMKGTEVFIENCLVKGPKKELQDVEVFMAVAPQVEALIKVRTARVKNF
jgi:hypothetical protein